MYKMVDFLTDTLDAEMERPIKQIGLTCDHINKVNEMADRVDRFNRKHGQTLVELEYMKTPSQEIEKGFAPYRLVFDFKTRAIARKFWTE